MTVSAAQIEICESVIDHCDIETLERLIARGKKRRVASILGKATELAKSGDRKAYMELCGSIANYCDESDLDLLCNMHPASPDYIMGMVDIFGGELVKSIEGMNFAAVEKAYGPEWYKRKVDALGHVI